MNMYEEQRQGIKRKLYGFIETLDIKGYLIVSHRQLALLLIWGIRFIDRSSIIRYPEFSMDDDFGLCFDWIKDKHNSFSLTIDENGLCHYAYIKQESEGPLDGGLKGHGHFKVGSSEFEDFDTRVSIIVDNIFG